MDHKLCVRLQYNPIVRLIERFGHRMTGKGEKTPHSVGKKVRGINEMRLGSDLCRKRQL